MLTMKCKKHGKNKTVAREKGKIIHCGTGETFTCAVHAMAEKELKKSLDFAVEYLEIQKTSLKQALDNVESNIEKLKRFRDSADSMNKNEDQI